jgi:hypothetical protein
MRASWPTCYAPGCCDRFTTGKTDHGRYASWGAVIRPSATILTRVMNRLKALYRGWGIACAGTQVYAARSREQWLSKIPQAGVRRWAQLLYQQLDGLQDLRREVRPELLAESRKHKAAKLRRQIPCIGPIRAARLIALMQTPHRFRSKRQLWEHNRDFATAEMEHRQNAERCRQDGANVEHRTDLQSASGPLSSRPILRLFVRLSHP